MYCPTCETDVGAPNWKARKTTLWSNQYGQGVRIFCDVCGQWTDLDQTDGEWHLVRIVRHPKADWKQDANQETTTVHGRL